MKQIHVTNESTLAFGLRLPVIRYPDWRQQPVRGALNERFATGPLSPTRRHFDLHHVVR